nr:MAG TPA: hypothetical protein [Caudoviricetes sp.]
MVTYFCLMKISINNKRGWDINPALFSFYIIWQKLV